MVEHKYIDHAKGAAAMFPTMVKTIDYCDFFMIKQIFDTRHARFHFSERIFLVFSTSACSVTELHPFGNGITSLNCLKLK